MVISAILKPEEYVREKRIARVVPGVTIHCFIFEAAVKSLSVGACPFLAAS